LDKKARWLAIALGWDSGIRVGQLAMPDGKASEDHTIRANSVTLEFEDGRSIPVGPEARAVLRLGSRPVMADLEFITSKTSRGQTVKTLDIKTLGRRSEMESLVLDDLCEWVLRSGVLATDPLLTRYSIPESRRKVITRKEISTAIKESAARLNVSELMFSSKSLRKGYASHCSKVGVSQEERNIRGGWTRNSRVPETNYMSSIGTQGALARLSHDYQGFDDGELRRMVTAGLRFRGGNSSSSD
jgi:hypothetical protein